MEIIINGIHWKVCGFCERYYEELICPCYFEKQNDELSRLMNNFRYFNTKHLFFTPYMFQLNNAKRRSSE